MFAWGLDDEALSHPNGKQQYQKASLNMNTSSTKTYYELLNVAPDASQTQIRRAYRQLALRFHPDKLVSAVSKKETDDDVNGMDIDECNEESRVDAEEGEDQFKLIAEAYEVLGDVETRQRYDLHLLSEQRERELRQSMEAQTQWELRRRQQQMPFGMRFGFEHRGGFNDIMSPFGIGLGFGFSDYFNEVNDRFNDFHNLFDDIFDSFGMVGSMGGFGSFGRAGGFMFHGHGFTFQASPNFARQTQSPRAQNTRQNRHR